uniref:LRRCT domain-containing protein n=1 Tax=Branchiostoma floridae TaxID=7739 RepID=C3XWM4_BRAFL|eukprot:XP_002611124.1 hypothetical protein BRAFLDRAFT_88479 [Branchiostoma floridae]
MANRLRYVKLDTVIEHLPKLRRVDLRFNKLASFSESELGRPQVTQAWINENPFRCDCDLSWLIDKLACFQACQGKQQACCLRCLACFVDRSLKLGAHICDSPQELNKLHLYKVSTRLTGCGAHQPTTEPTVVTSVMFPTDGTRTHTLSAIPTSSAQTIATSLLNATGTTVKPRDYKLPVLHITIILMGTFLAMALVLFGFRWLCVKINTPEEAVNHGHQPVNHGHQPVNHGHQPVNQGHQPVNHGHQPVNHGHQPVNHGHQPVNHGHQPVNHGHQPVNHGHQPVNHGHQPVNQTTSPTVDHVYENPTGALDGRDSAAMDGGPSTAPPTDTIHSTDDGLDGGHGAVRGGTELDTVIEHLPKLRKVDLRFNKLASFSESELGRPQVAEAWINGNPFRCDCDLSWLVHKLACFQACQGKQQDLDCSMLKSTPWKELSIMDTSLSIMDTSLSIMGTSLSIPDTSLSIMDTSLSIMGTSLSIMGTSLSITGTSLSIMGTSLSITGTSLSITDTSLSIMDTSLSIKLHHQQ